GHRLRPGVRLPRGSRPAPRGAPPGDTPHPGAEGGGGHRQPPDRGLPPGIPRGLAPDRPVPHPAVRPRRRPAHALRGGGPGALSPGRPGRLPRPRGRVVNTPGLRVIQPGPLTSVQDLGRRGVLHLGLTSAGPLDGESFAWANRLCGNPANAPALEIALGGLVLEALAPLLATLTGPAAPLAVNGQPAPPWQGLRLAAGDRLSLGPTPRGGPLYLAVRGGFAVATPFGSAATVAREGLGGIAGRPLARGDLLPVNPLPGPARRFALPAPLRPAYPEG